MQAAMRRNEERHPPLATRGEMVGYNPTSLLPASLIGYRFRHFLNTASVYINSHCSPFALTKIQVIDVTLKDSLPIHYELYIIPIWYFFKNNLVSIFF